jgi:tetratricopeptide (TPR) repeat protein
MADVFVSYNGLDRPAVARLCSELVKRGITPFFDTWDMIPGRRWQGALLAALDQYKSAAVCFGPKGLGNWQRLEQEIALNRHARQGDHFPVIPVLLPGVDLSGTPLGFLQLHTWIDLREETPASYDALAAAVRGEKLAHNERLRTDALFSINPYRGLAYFREEDAPFFFGREDFTTEVYEAVNKSSFVAIVGGSGSGKSSIAHAGLLPKLRDPTHGRVWSILTMSPGSDPAERLAEILTPALNPQLELTSFAFDVELVGIKRRLVAEAADEKGALGRMVRQLCNMNRGIDRVLLLIDQFEEVFTLASPEKQAATSRFIEEIVLAAKNPEAPLTIVVTMRGDQYHRVTDQRDLARLFKTSQINVGAMTAPELRQAIEEPAKKLGARFEEGLIERILVDLGTEAGALPLLEYALDALWKHRDPVSGTLTHKAYNAQGGVKRAIAERANEVYHKLTLDQQAAAREVLLRLVRPGEGVLDSKRLADLGEVDEATRAAVTVLAKERLIVVGDNTIEITHEALIREWDLLRDWVNEARDDLALRDRLESEAARWVRLAAVDPTTAETLLLPLGLRLEEGRRLIEKSAILLGGFPAIRGYITRSIEADENRVRREREKQEVELAQARQHNKKLKVAVGVAALLLVVAGAVGVFASRQSRQAEQAAHRAEQAVAAIIGSADNLVTGMAQKYRPSDRANELRGEVLDHGIQIADEAIKLDPGSDGAYGVLGVAYALKAQIDNAADNFGLAIENFTKAIEINPKNAGHYDNRGHAYYDKGLYDLAMKDYNKAIELDPSLTLAYVNRGVVYYDRGFYDLAIKDYSKAIETDQENPTAYSNRGSTYLVEEKYDLAIADLDRAIDFDPKFAAGLFNRGNAYAARGQEYFNTLGYDRAIEEYSRAIEDFGKVIDIDPKRIDALNNRGNAYTNRGIASDAAGKPEDVLHDLDRAITDYTLSIELFPKFAVGLRNRGHANLLKGEIDSAFQDYNKAVEVDTNPAYSYADRGKAYAFEGDFSRAIADFDAAILNTPEYLFAYRSRARVYFYQANFSAAAADFQSAMKGGSNAWDMLWLYLARVRMGENGAAELAANSAELKTKDWPFPVIELYLGQRSPAEVLSTVDRLAARCEPQFYTGEWYLLNGKRSDAAAALRQAVKLCPKTFWEYLGAKVDLTRLPQ